jgi:hypothetical protein
MKHNMQTDMALQQLEEEFNYFHGVIGKLSMNVLTSRK